MMPVEVLKQPVSGARNNIALSSRCLFTWLGTTATGILGSNCWATNAIAATTVSTLFLLANVMVTTVNSGSGTQPSEETPGR